MPLGITPAPAVEKLAKSYIKSHHPHLKDAPITYVFLDKTPVSNGKETWGRARKISGLNAYLAGNNGDFFVMEISRPVWDELDDNKREALVDHELCHMGVGDDYKIYIKPHDVEEFSAIIERHGVWTTETEKLVNAAAQYYQTTFDFGADGDGAAPDGTVEAEVMSTALVPTTVHSDEAPKKKRGRPRKNLTLVEAALADDSGSIVPAEPMF